jgi:hypothetical protein
LKILGPDLDINNAWETIRKNIKISAEEIKEISQTAVVTASKQIT